MKRYRSGLLISAALAGGAALSSQAFAQTQTVAAFFDISQGSNNIAVFQRAGGTFTGGYGGTGLTLRTPGLLTVPDADAACLTMWAAVHGVCEILLMEFGFEDEAAEAFIVDTIETVLAGQMAPRDVSS